MNVVPTPPVQLNAAIPPALSDLVVACLAKNPQDRPRSAAEVLRTLDELSSAETWTDDDARTWWKAKASAIAALRKRSAAETVDYKSRGTHERGGDLASTAATVRELN